MRILFLVTLVVIAQSERCSGLRAPASLNPAPMRKWRQRLAKLRQDTDPKAFLGFCTRDDDALYFVHQGGGFFLDYELNTPAKKSHADAFQKTAAELGFVVTDTSYGDFPVLRVKAGASEGRAAEVGFNFAQRLFGHDGKTVVEFLP